MAPPREVLLQVALDPAAHVTLPIDEEARFLIARRDGPGRLGSLVVGAEFSGEVAELLLRGRVGIGESGSLGAVGTSHVRYSFYTMYVFASFPPARGRE